jgi:DNA (cytosine-5)-methyltransferase 1
MLTHVSLFSGIGGFSIAAEMAGFKDVLFCEIDPFCQSVLRYHWPGVPIVKDVRDVNKQVVADAAKLLCYGSDDNGRSIRQTGRAISQLGNSDSEGMSAACQSVTLLTAGVPCQPISVAGKRRGAADDRWLWPEAIRVLGEVKPLHAVFENPTGLASMVEFDSLLEVDHKEYSDAEMASGLFAVGEVQERTGRGILAKIMGDIESQGYTVEDPVVIPACAINAVHRRDRVFIVAHANGVRFGRESTEGQRGNISEQTRIETQPCGSTSDTLHCEGARIGRECRGGLSEQEPEGLSESVSGNEGSESEPRICCLDDGISARLAGYPDWAGGDWEAPEPLAQSSKGRVNKLKALGNAVVWAQVYPVLKAIAAPSNGAGMER